jgi:hypothetical protein
MEATTPAEITVPGERTRPVTTAYPAPGADALSFRALWPCILVKNRRGLVDHHYPELNALIPWMSDEQAAQLLEYGAIERIHTAPTQPDTDTDADEHQDATQAPREPDGGGITSHPGVVEDCIRTLDQLRDEYGPKVPNSAGRPTCATALREAGVTFANNVIAEAVRQRKGRAETDGEP